MTVEERGRLYSLHSFGSRVAEKEASRVPVVIHLKLLNQREMASRVLCKKLISSVDYVFVTWFETSEHLDRVYGPNGFTIQRSTRWIYPDRGPFRSYKNGGKAVSCPTCIKAFEEELSYHQSKAARVEEKETKPVDSGFEPPTRPPGTEEMTGHLDEGSVAGACGEAGIGFKTKYLPWITCAKCLVAKDELEEMQLVELDGLYVKPTSSKA